MEGPTIGILAPFFSGHYYSRVTEAITRVVWEARGRVVAVQTASYVPLGYREGVNPTPPPRVGWDHLTGVVTVSNAVPRSYIEDLLEAGKPVVAMSQRGLESLCPVVVPNNSVREAVEHLLEHGHTRIAFAGCLDHFDVKERYDSYCQTLTSHGIEPDPALFFPADENTETGGRQAASLMIAAGLPSSAVIVATDYNAMGILAVLKQAGYLLPRDQAIVSFDDFPVAGLVNPGLSTVKQDFGDLGTVAARLLLAKTRGEPVESGRHLVGTSLVIRQSCGCPASWAIPALGKSRRSATPARRFISDLARSLAPESGPRTREVARLGAQIGHVFEAAARGEVTPESLLMMNGSCQELYRLDPSPSAYSVILSLARQLSADLAPLVGELPAQASRQLNECVVEVGHGLSKVLLGEGND
ncbi:MAG TPA: substrate-binding domain-containing protein, partial [Acidimicrobiales bacterium]|nr:substrate-binding domain-containing protein [Acidimicrobiales bacterium]